MSPFEKQMALAEKKGNCCTACGAAVFATPDGLCPQCGDSKDLRTAGDSVNHPPHYTAGKIEPIDVIEDWNLGFHLGNAVKYIARAAHKGSELQDLAKARWYLDRYITEAGRKSNA